LQFLQVVEALLSDNGLLCVMCHIMAYARDKMEVDKVEWYWLTNAGFPLTWKVGGGSGCQRR